MIGLIGPLVTRFHGLATDSFRRLGDSAPAAILMIIVLITYSFSIAPGVDFWDTGELETVSYLFGVAHPNGFPLFVMLSWLSSHLVPWGSVAWRVSLITALAGATACGAIFYLCRSLGASLFTAVGGSVILALSEIFWSRASRAEPHVLATAATIIALLCAIRYYETRQRAYLASSAATYGCALASHSVAILSAPALLLLTAMSLLRRPHEHVSRDVALVATLVIIPCLAYLYIPVRSAYIETHHLDPAEAIDRVMGSAYWDSGQTAAPSAFWRYLTASESNTRDPLVATLDPREIAGSWTRLLPDATTSFGFPVILVVFPGMIVLARRRPVIALAFLLAGSTYPVFVYHYAEADPARYLLVPLSLIAVLLVLSLEALAVILPFWGVVASTCVVLGLIAHLWLSNSRIIDYRQHDLASTQMVESILSNTPDSAIIVSEWALGPPLGYAAYVERRAGKRLVLVAWPAEFLNRVQISNLRTPVFFLDSNDHDMSAFGTVVVRGSFYQLTAAAVR